MANALRIRISRYCYGMLILLMFLALLLAHEKGYGATAPDAAKIPAAPAQAKSTPESLKQLKDIHLPAPISWWPLAPGWYILAALLLFIFLALAYKIYQRYLDSRPKKQALKLLDEYYQQYEKQRNCSFISARVSELLKRVALAYYPRKNVAGLKGEDWIHFLNRTGKEVNFNPVKNMLLELPYQPNETCSLKPLFTRAERWIKQRRKPCSN
ncbi:DUF4381 domain-containing protein [Legionella israelensis]